MIDTFTQRNSHFGAVRVRGCPQIFTKSQGPSPEILSRPVGDVRSTYARPEPLRGGGKSPNLFVKISGRALTFCKNLGATPNPEQANCEFTRRKRHIHEIGNGRLEKPYKEGIFRVQFQGGGAGPIFTTRLQKVFPPIIGFFIGNFFSKSKYEEFFHLEK